MLNFKVELNNDFFQFKLGLELKRCMVGNINKLRYKECEDGT